MYCESTSRVSFRTSFRRLPFWGNSTARNYFSLNFKRCNCCFRLNKYIILHFVFVVVVLVSNFALT